MVPPLLFILGLVELLSVLVVVFIALGVPAVLAVAVYHYYDGKNAYEERITLLEQRVEQLERERSE